MHNVSQDIILQTTSREEVNLVLLKQNEHQHRIVAGSAKSARTLTVQVSVDHYESMSIRMNVFLLVKNV